MSKESRKQQFIFEIEKKILSGEWKVGDKLPTERELVDVFSASRTVVNAGLSALAQKGFLSIHPRQWTKVADYMKDGKLEVLYTITRFNGDNLDMALIQGILDARKVVETESVRLACLNHTPDDIGILEEIIKAEKKACSIDERIKIDFQFHHMLCVASKNPVYPLIMNSFEPIANKYLKIFYSIVGDNYKIHVEHIDIINAIKENDPEEAVKLLHLLLHEGEKVLKRYGGNIDE